MNKTRVVAATAVLTAAAALAFAACGDDDDDAAGGDTTEAVAPAASPAPGGDATPPPAAEGTAPAQPGTPGSPPDDPELEADCQAVFGVFEDNAEVEALELNVGDEITDEAKDQLEGFLDDVEDLDLQTDEARAARDELIDVTNDYLDADTVTEEMAGGEAEAFVSFGSSCQPFLQDAAGG